MSSMQRVVAITQNHLMDRRKLAELSYNLSVTARTIQNRNSPFHVCAVQREPPFGKPQCRKAGSTIFRLRCEHSNAKKSLSERRMLARALDVLPAGFRP